MNIVSTLNVHLFTQEKVDADVFMSEREHNDISNPYMHLCFQEYFHILGIFIHNNCLVQDEKIDTTITFVN